MAWILHIDTSAETGTVALAQDGVVKANKTNTQTRDHASVINLYINELLSDCNISLADVSAFCVCGGPGSYTGLRIGLSTAKGFCYAMEKPLMLQNRLLLMTLPYINHYKTIISVLQARQSEYFIGIYNDRTEEVLPPKHIHTQDLRSLNEFINADTIIAGAVEEEITTAFGENTTYKQGLDVNINNWATYAHEQYQCNAFVSLASSTPYYLKQVFTHK